MKLMTMIGLMIVGAQKCDTRRKPQYTSTRRKPQYYDARNNLRNRKKVVPLHPDYVPYIFNENSRVVALDKLRRYERYSKRSTQPISDSQDTVSVDLLPSSQHSDTSESNPASLLQKKLDEQRTLNASMQEYINTLQEERDKAINDLQKS